MMAYAAAGAVPGNFGGSPDKFWQNLLLRSSGTGKFDCRGQGLA